MSKLIKQHYSKNSLQNFMTVMLSITGLFVLYRYIKSIEKDSKIIQNYVLELESRVKNIEKFQTHLNNTAHHQAVDNTISVSSFNESVNDVIVTDDNNDNLDDNDDLDDDNFDDDDDESIGSEDITNLLKKVILGNIDMNEALPEVTEVVESESDETKTNQYDIVEDNKSDDITISYKTETEYKKMNLTELRKLLKDKNMSTKGSKNELVTRLLSC